MRRGQWYDTGLLWLCLVSFAVVVHAALTPYDFLVSNRVGWLDEGHGLRFERRAIAATESAFSAPLDAAASSSIEIWLRRDATAPADGGVVLALGEGEGAPPLLLAQWKSSLYFRFPARSDGEVVEETLTIRPDLAPGELHVVALVTYPGGTRIFLDGSEIRLPEARSRATPVPGALRGRVALGSRLQASRAWTGRIEGLAIFDRALDASEVRAHASLGRSAQTLAGAPGIVGLYPFREGSGSRARDVAGGVGDLLLPSRYAPLAPGWLRLRLGNAEGSLAPRDVAVNLVGFVPVGWLLFAALTRWTGLSTPSRAATAVACATALSLGIETIQTLLPSRVSSALDLATNASGALLGVGIGVALRRWIPRGTRGGPDAR